MNRKVSIILSLSIMAFGLMMLSACGSSSGDNSGGSAEWPAMDSLSSIGAADITSIDYTRATEAGISGDTVSDAATIEDIYLRLKDVSATGESEMGVDDDGLGIKLVTGDKTLSFNFEGDILVLEDGSRYAVENLDSLKSYIDKLAEGSAAGSDVTAGAGTETVPDSSPGSDNRDPAAGSSDYDVSKGFTKKVSSDGTIEYLYFNDFMVTMPNNDKWSFEMDGNSVSFYLFSAQQEGYGGRLVTVQAYDIDDSSYEYLPMAYQVAGVGRNVNKRFIAIYPSDVQYNFDDAGQKADYEDLYNYLKKIGEGAVNSPLQTADGD